MDEQTGRPNPPDKYGVVFSQLHAVDLADIDGDGLKDIVDGKRFWAHGHNGPIPNPTRPRCSTGSSWSATAKARWISSRI